VLGVRPETLQNLVGVQLATVGLAPWRVRTSQFPRELLPAKYPWPFATDPVRLRPGEAAESPQKKESRRRQRCSRFTVERAAACATQQSYG